MKKCFILVIFLMSLFVFAGKTGATVTIYAGGTIGGSETIADDYNMVDFSGKLDSSVFEFTYIRDIEIRVEQQSGKSDYFGAPSMQLSNITFGFPVVDQKKYIIYLTMGHLEYTREKVSQAQGFMLGADLIYIASEKIYLGATLQYSVFGGSYQQYAPFYMELPMDQISLKLTGQFIFTAHLGMIANVRYLRFDANSGLIVENEFIPSLGLIYRL